MDDSGNPTRGVFEQIAVANAQVTKQAGVLVSVVVGTISNVDAIATAAEEISHEVTQVATAADEMSHQVRQIAEQSNEISQKVDATSKDSAHSVSQLQAGALQIGKVVGVINDITDRIHLLALNAKIEAARAGVAGACFSVVANEVGLLARSTAKATGDISEIISSMQQTTGLVVETIQRFQSVRDAVRSVDARIQEVGAFATTFAHSADQVSKQAGEIASGSAELTGEVCSFAEYVGELRTSSEHVTTLVSQMH
jgi:methyl-accepting chemotaxis protein